VSPLQKPKKQTSNSRPRGGLKFLYPNLKAMKKGKDLKRMGGGKNRMRIQKRTMSIKWGKLFQGGARAGSSVEGQKGNH